MKRKYDIWKFNAHRSLNSVQVLGCKIESCIFRQPEYHLGVYFVLIHIIKWKKIRTSSTIRIFLPLAHLKTRSKNTTLRLLRYVIMLGPEKMLTVRR